MFFNPMMLSGTATNVLEAVLSVLTAIGTWFVSTITDMLPIFYAPDTGLTIIGVLSCCGLGVGVILMIAMFIKNFFHWR